MALGVMIDSETLKAFKVAVMQKHGKIRGAYQDEITEALRIHTQHLKSEMPDS